MKIYYYFLFPYASLLFVDKGNFTLKEIDKDFIANEFINGYEKTNSKVLARAMCLMGVLKKLRNNNELPRGTTFNVLDLTMGKHFAKHGLNAKSVAIRDKLQILMTNYDIEVDWVSLVHKDPLYDNFAKQVRLSTVLRKSHGY